ncbi:hypothetical protein Tco_0824615 [Tanacetum coccineum]|uniref:Uncharacterized protein n=1 Tax=Tanacetum coccineum TaxID=301880 RepID=A0ABQ5AMC0_9ASTR
MNNKASKDGAVSFTTVAYGNTQEENVGQSSTCPTGPTASESGPDVSFASLLHGESKRKGLNFRTLIKQAGNRANVNLHGLPVTAFTEDGLSVIATDIGTPLILDSYTSDICIQSWGISRYARVLIEIWADVELKDTIVEECPKNLDLGVAKNLKKPSQASRGVPVGPKVGFKPVKEYRLVAKKLTANTSGNKKKGVEPTKEVSNSNPFDVLNLVVNDKELGTDWGGGISTTPIVEKIRKLEQLIIEGKVSLVDDAGKSLKRVDYPGDHNSDDEVCLVDNDMTRSMATKAVGFGTQSLLKKWRESYGNGDYDEDPYDDDMYEGQDLPDNLQDICLDIRV